VIKFYLHGELGNQMFQWATGVALAVRNSTSVVFQTTHKVPFRMSEFVASETQAVHGPLKTDSLAISFPLYNRVPRIAHRFINGFREVGNNYQDLYFREGRRYFGYFQSWRYFHTIRDEIVGGFQLRQPSSQFQHLISALPTEFTGIHIRRGGEGKAVLAKDFHGLLDLEYYRKAVSLSKRLGAPENYVVFTDNLAKAQPLIQGLGLGDAVIISPDDGFSQCENLHLMAKSNCLIGANSSYSWWAAYLSSEQKTPPIFPRQWYMDPNISTNDMLLPRWVSIGFEMFQNEKKFRHLSVE
jgi:hypothetical protein